MEEYIKKKLSRRPKIKKVVGVILILLGVLALLTPFTPGSWLIFVGMGLLGLHFSLWDRIRSIFKEHSNDNPL